MKLHECAGGQIVILDNIEFVDLVKQFSTKSNNRFYGFMIRFVSGADVRISESTEKEAEEVRKKLVRELESYSVDQSL